MCTNTLLVIALGTLIASCASTGKAPTRSSREDTIYVAVEEDGTLAELDGTTGALIRTIDLSDQAHGSTVRFDVHNAQGAPDGRTVWVTVMPTADGAHASSAPMPEQLIGVDTVTSKVRDRIELGEDLHVAHVVVAAKQAYVTAYDADSVLVVDLAAKTVVRTIRLPAGTKPHGARLTADGRTLIVAGMGDGSMHVIDTEASTVKSYDLPGRAVQAAVLPDGSAAFVTIYDTRQIAKLDLVSKQLSIFDLPEGAAGPVQIYPTPAARLWIADQGMIDGDPAGDKLYLMNAASGAIEREVPVSPAPHGVVVSPDGTVWTTTLVEGTVQAIDGETGEVLSTTSVGNKPNGITCIHTGGVMP